MSLWRSTYTQRYFKFAMIWHLSFAPEGGISIPADYTSYVSPMSSVKLFNEVTNFNNPKNFETAYVVKFHAVHILTEAQPCFTFVHPSYSENKDCSRCKRLKFKIPQSALLHGFAGFFESKLYDN